MQFVNNLAKYIDRFFPSFNIMECSEMELDILCNCVTHLSPFQFKAITQENWERSSEHIGTVHSHEGYLFDEQSF